MLEPVYFLQELLCVSLALLLILAFMFHQHSQGVHLRIDDFDIWIAVEEPVAP